MKNQFSDFCANIMCNAIESCLNWNLSLDGKRGEHSTKKKRMSSAERATECDTLRRGEISKRKGNIKRCCWHRSVQSFGVLFHGSFGISGSSWADHNKKRMFRRKKRDKTANLCFRSFNRFWRIKFVNMNFKLMVPAITPKPKLRLLVVIWPSEHSEKGSSSESDRKSPSPERISLAHPIKHFHKFRSRLVPRLPCADKLTSPPLVH